MGGLQQNNLPPGGCSGLCESAVCQGAFLLQKPPLVRAASSSHNSPAKALDDKGFRTLRRATKGFAFGNHKLLKKLDQNFYFFFAQTRFREVKAKATHPTNTRIGSRLSLVPRGKSQGHSPNQYVNWQRAQPAERSRRQAICARTSSLVTQEVRSRIGCRLSLP